MARLAIHPGEHVQEEMDALSLSASEFAARLDIPAETLEAVLSGKLDLSADLALRLAHFFGTSAQFWMNLQTIYDLRLAEEAHGHEIKGLPTMKQLAAA